MVNMKGLLKRILVLIEKKKIKINKALKMDDDNMFTKKNSRSSRREKNKNKLYVHSNKHIRLQAKKSEKNLNNINKKKKEKKD